MSTPQERRAALNANSGAKAVWIIMLVLQGLGIIALLLGAAALGIFGASSGGLGGAIAIIGVVLVIISLGLATLIFWGTFRLEKWIQWLMWANVVLNVISTMTSDGNYISLIIPIMIAVGYRWILGIVNAPAGTPTPVMTPPATPKQ